MFGSLCYSTSLDSHRTKLAARAKKFVFLGYSIAFKGFVLLDIHTREIHISRHVSFHEYIFPYPPSSSYITIDWDYFSSDASTSNPADIHSPPLPPLFIDIEPPPIDPNHSPSPIISPIDPPPLRRSSRNTNQPTHLQDYVCNFTNASASLSSDVSYPIHHYMSFTNLSPSHCAYPLSLNSHT